MLSWRTSLRMFHRMGVEPACQRMLFKLHVLETHVLAMLLADIAVKRQATWHRQG